MSSKIKLEARYVEIVLRVLKFTTITAANMIQIIQKMIMLYCSISEDYWSLLHCSLIGLVLLLLLFNYYWLNIN